MTEQAADTGGAEAALRGKVQRVGLLSDGGIPNLSPRIKLQSSEGGDTLVHCGRRIAWPLNLRGRDEKGNSCGWLAAVGIPEDFKIH